MIVQCPQCQAKFNLADEKVTEKGLKVRCSKCKNVFEVKKEAGPKPETIPQPKSLEEDKFNFGEDFDFSEPISTERAPQTPKQKEVIGKKEEAEPQKEAEDFNFEEDVDFSSDEFGVETKTDDLGMSPDMPVIPGPPAEEKGTEEAPFEEEFGDFKIDRGTEIPVRSVKEEAVGDSFDFSGKLESYARTESPKPKAQPGEDLEAKLELEPEAPPPSPPPAATAPVREMVRPSPARQPPLTYQEEKGRGLKIFLLLFLLLLLLSPVGGLLYLNSQGSFTFSDLKALDFEKLKNAPEVKSILVMLGLAKPELKGNVSVLKEVVTYREVPRREGGKIAVVQGRVRNDYPVPVSYIRVEVNLYDANRNVLASAQSYCDVRFDETELATMSQSEILEWMEVKAGRNMNNKDIEPGGERIFTVVFFQIPPGLANYDVQVKNFEIVPGQ